MNAHRDVLCIHPDDDMLVALNDLAVGAVVYCDQEPYRISSLVRRKHKFARRAFAVGELLKLYGVPVGRATQPIRKGEAITTDNLTHYAAEVDWTAANTYQWTPPDVSRWRSATFKGVVRSDGRVGTANYWLIFPLVFCENRNVERLRNALEGPLGYANEDLAAFAHSLLNDGAAVPKAVRRPFENLDGIRMITHAGGCGGTRADARALCKILAAYADHPNVAGVTVFSLGCQNAQISMFEDALKAQNSSFDKPCLILRATAMGRRKGHDAGRAASHPESAEPSQSGHATTGALIEPQNRREMWRLRRILGPDRQPYDWPGFGYRRGVGRRLAVG